MNKAMKILDIGSIWNKKNPINDGDVLETEYFPQDRKFYFVDPKDTGEYILDQRGVAIWFDQDDIDSEYLEEWVPELPKPKQNVTTVEPERSANIASATYFDKEKLLLVAFTKGGIYQYQDVPRELFHGMLKSESIGRFFAEKIKNNFKLEKVLTHG